MLCIVFLRMLSELLTTGGEMSKFIVADLSTIVQGFCVDVSLMKSAKARTHPMGDWTLSRRKVINIYNVWEQSLRQFKCLEGRRKALEGCLKAELAPTNISREQENGYMKLFKSRFRCQTKHLRSRK